MKYIVNTCTCSEYNLALEQYMFERLPKTESYFMLWQNSPSVIVGKYQNAFEEVNATYLKEERIGLTRRLSGGGAVYHDLGNVNYTFIVNENEAHSGDMELCKPLLDALSFVGIDAEISGRNDITIDGKKISGTAQYRSGGRMLHHGTILFDSDLEKMQKVLTPPICKIESKGMKSVRSRVTNIREYLRKDISLKEFQKLLFYYTMKSGSGYEYFLSEEDRMCVKRLEEERYATHEWNWGNSPKCSVRKERRIKGCGTIQIFLSVTEGCIDDIEIYGDFFGEGMSQELKTSLLTVPMDYTALLTKLSNIDVNKCFHRMTRETLAELIAY